MAATLAVLRALRQLGPGEHPLALIAVQAELPTPTARRYLEALAREGAVERREPREWYALPESPHRSPQFFNEIQATTTGNASSAIRTELVSLQSRTGQIALVYVPYLIGPPVRICTERAIGPHAQELMAASEQARRSLWCAPLDADASGLAVLACLEETGPMSATLARIRERGHAISASPLEGRDAVSAPLWRGGTVVGSVTLLVFQPQMRSTGMRGRYVNNVLASAAGMSEQLSPSVLPRGADRLPA